MKLPIEESDFVFCDVQDIVRYLKKRNPATAIRFLQAFQLATSRLSEMPHLGRSQPDLGALGGWVAGVIIFCFTKFCRIAFDSCAFSMGRGICK